MRHKKVLIILGPNLNLTGIRGKSIYGQETAESIESQIISLGEEIGISCNVFQSNWEGALIDKIHECAENYDGGIINAGALSHYSLAIRDAIACSMIPFIETHMTNIFSRENFRKHSVISEVCVGQIIGFGKESYFLALRAIKNLI